MIKKEQYKKKAEAGKGKVLSNVRLRWTGGGRKTARDARETMRSIIHEHKVPKGWQVAVVQWGHPKKEESLEACRDRLKATDGWRDGDIEDLFEMFSGLFEHYLDRLQVGVVE